MAEDHPFTIDIDRDVAITSNFRWSIHENGKLREHSSTSYETKREALLGARKVLQRLVTHWQTGKC
jgi:hypothetical protein